MTKAKTAKKAKNALKVKTKLTAKIWQMPKLLALSTALLIAILTSAICWWFSGINEVPATTIPPQTTITLSPETNNTLKRLAEGKLEVTFENISEEQNPF
ncbi:MAG: hypothetical protein ACD_68C00133G0003 [uncultured bacterium]|nr:MAG: hypothetical protein ACD_68C00133G0003 [uncultured bacterium]